MGKQKKHRNEIHVAKRGQKANDKVLSDHTGKDKSGDASSTIPADIDKDCTAMQNNVPVKSDKLEVPQQETSNSLDSDHNASKPTDMEPEAARERSSSAKQANSTPTQDRQSNPPTRKVSNQRKVSRKISEGLKQLPQDAYRFVRESYLLLDSEGAGSVNRETLKDILISIGLQDSGNKRLNQMLELAGDPITFAGYLTIMGELLGDMSTHEEMDIMLQAFQNEDGDFNQREMRETLLSEGLSVRDIDEVMNRFSKPSKYGQVFDWKAFAETMSI